MELLVTPDSFIIVQGEQALLCSKLTGLLTNAKYCPKSCDGICIGVIDGVIGELVVQDVVHVLIITRSRLVAQHPYSGDDIIAIEQVQALSLCEQSIAPTALRTCPTHSHMSTNSPQSGIDLLQKGSRKFMKGTSNSFKSMSDQMGQKMGMNKTKTPPAVDASRALENVLRLFNETVNFYYCKGTDLTLRLSQLINDSGESKWNSEFFWNSHLLEKSLLNTIWCITIIQGFVGQKEVSLEAQDKASLGVTLISRRSVFRAGTRYMKRGIDEQGHCANFVESEQTVKVLGHCVSFTMIRGSIPLFWTQRGLKYRPVPRLERGRKENLDALSIHLTHVHENYGSPLTLVNLVDQTGRELPLAEAFLDHILEVNDKNIDYVSFDFHDHCRGLRLDKVDILVRAMHNSLKDAKFTWIDNKRSLICKQQGVIRVNCVDCLDRTNVVQLGLARAALNLQLMKLGLFPPEESLPQSLTMLMQLLWADNGDAVSKQYAGTAALKGDFTRSGQRNIYGLVKDGYNSASRYYLNHIRDARRQVAIELMLGIVPDSSAPQGNNKENEAADSDAEIVEELRLLVQECQTFYLPEDEILLGAWALIDCDPSTGGDLSGNDMDRTVMLTRTALHIADYDQDLDKFTDCVRIPLNNISGIEVGPLSISNSLPNALRSMSMKPSKNGPTCIRIHYLPPGISGTPFIYTWRAGDTRLFNNVAIALKSQEEADEYVHAIAEQFAVAMQVANIEMNISKVAKMERKRTRIVANSPNSKGSRFTGLFSNFSLKSGNTNFWTPFSPVAPPIVVLPILSSFCVHVPSAGVLFTCKLLADGPKTTENIRNKWSSAPLIFPKVPLLPLFILPSSPEETEDALSRNLNHNPENARSSTCLNDVTDVPSLDVTNLRMRPCRSEGVIKDLSQQQQLPQNGKLMGRIATEGGKLLGLTSSSFRKWTSPKEAKQQIQMPRKIQERANVFQEFKQRIVESQTKITLL